MPARFVSLQLLWSKLAGAGVGLLASWLTVVQGLPYGHDSIRHLYWLVERDYLMRHGVVYTRWSPLLGYGYGYPLYNFYPPLLYYLAEPFMVMGSGPLVALQLILGLALVGASLGMYCWVSNLFGVGPGVVAAMSYLFSPYMMYTLLNRGGFSEILALTWLPWSLWSLRRFAKQRHPIDGITTALMVAAALLTHLLTGFIVVATLVIYSAAFGLIFSRGGRLSASWLYLSWPVVLGLGLAAFVWLPAMMESNLVAIERMHTLGDPTKGEGLMPFWQVFAGQVLPDPHSPVATIAPRLSWLAAGLGAFGVITGVMALRSLELKMHLLVGLSLILMTVFMVTPAAQPLWQRLPMLHLISFPFRLLAGANVWLAMLNGAGTAALLVVIGPTMRGHPVAVGSMVAVLCLALGWYTFQWPAVAYHDPATPVALEAIAQFERVSGQMGLLAANEYLPKTVKQLPPPVTGPASEFSRLKPSALPNSARLIQVEHGLFHDRFVIDTPQPFRAVFNAIYFPGWWASRDGQLVQLTPTEPHGLISLAVPAGKHRIEIGFGTTPPRTIANCVSLVSLIGLLALLLNRAHLLFSPQRQV